MPANSYHAIKAVFLDRDGVINREQGHITKLEDFKILDGVPEAISKLNKLGIKVIIASNQSGIARGLLTIEVLNDIHAFLHQTLKNHDAHIDAFYYSPWHPDTSLESGVKEWLGDHPDRKPNAGMIFRGMKDFQLLPSEVCMIGDSGKDQQAAAKAGIDFFAVRSAKYREIDQSSCVLFDSLLETVNYLIISEFLYK